MSAVITPFEGTELFNTESFNNRISQINTGFSYVSNPNLLDNWYFGRAVNQRGQTEYTDSWAYSIDRWLCGGDGKVTIADGHCVFYGAVDQGLSVEMSDILGCTMTASLLLTDGTLITGTAVNTDNSIDIPFVSGVGGMYIGLNATDLSKHRRFRIYIAPERAVLAAKLELGPTQTLAHREGDKWVLNEIPDYGEQLLRCQRYYQKFDENVTLFYGNSGSSGGAGARLFLPTAVQMRTKPVTSPFVINVMPDETIAGTNNITFTPSDVSVVPGGVCLYGAVSPSVSIGSYTYKAILAQLRNAPLALSADL